MTSVRCAILEHPIPGFRPADAILACPTGLYRTHYHGHDPAGPFRPMVPGRPCQHRHQSVEAAIRCSERLDGRKDG